METVTSRIISSGMSDLEKELAINNYLCENGTYWITLNKMAIRGSIRNTMMRLHPTGF